MAEAQTPSEIESLLASHGVRPRKRLGQHFLADGNVVDKIVATADIDGRPVLEIGAGTGTLTSALAARAARVVAYEIDGRLRPVLEHMLAGRANVELRFADAAAPGALSDLGGGAWALVANLPYNVGTPLLLDLLRHRPRIDRFVVMVQREVADRLRAGPGSRRYGLPSVTVALHTDKKDAFGVSRHVFIPAPNVDSTVLRLDRKPPRAAAEAALELAARAFARRRQMLRRSLGEVVTAEQMQRAGIDPEARPEQLAPSDFVRLAEAAP